MGLELPVRQVRPTDGVHGARVRTGRELSDLLGSFPGCGGQVHSKVHDNYALRTTWTRTQRVRDER